MCAALSAAGGTGFAPKRAASPSAPGATPVIVELFTSEGCSDCPSADALLAALARTQPVRGAEIIPLEEHVDYWNHGGWSDPFSSAGATRRQNAYASRARSDEVYTPQMVVNGGAQFVGSDRTEALQSIRQAAAEAMAPVAISLHGAARTPGLRISIGALPRAEDSAAEVIVAETEDDLVSHVGGGENGGRVLRHSAVLLALATAGSVGSSGGTVDAILPATGSRPKNTLHVVAFVQERGTGRILGASEASL